MEEDVLLVLFGAPSAGKSSLLGALVQAAEGHDHVLKGKLIDRSSSGMGRLADLHQALCQDRQQPTTDEVVSYPIAIEVEKTSAKDALPAAVLADCSGRSVQALLADKRPWEKKARAGPLGKAVLNADTLILVVDASADTAQLNKDFSQLANFVRALEQSRSRGSEVAGLPVYVVLTKCDQLAKMSDTTSAWMQRIEEKKRQVDDAFKKFLAQQPERDSLAFGKVDLHLWATAARRPALADRHAVDPQPYGVAELFRQCLQDARKFHLREIQASKRLQVVVAGVGGLLALMTILAFAVYITRPSPELISLENALHGLLPAEGAKPAERLREPLDDKLKQLRRIQKNPNFTLLPAKTQAEVDNHVREIDAYQKFNREFLQKVQDPRLATTEEDLANIEKAIKEISPPDEYAEAWKDTRIGRRSKLWLMDAKALRDESAKVVKWIEEKKKAGEALEKDGYGVLAKGAAATAKEKDAWLERYQKYLDQPWPHRPREHPPGAGTITYDTVYRFQPVQQARQNWDDFKKSLLFIHNRLM